VKVHRQGVRRQGVVSVIEAVSGEAVPRETKRLIGLKGLLGFASVCFVKAKESLVGLVLAKTNQV